MLITLPAVTCPDTSVCKTPLLTSASEITRQLCGRSSVMWYDLGVISTIRCSCYMQCLGCEWVIILGFPSVMYPSSNWDGYLLYCYTFFTWTPFTSTVCGDDSFHFPSIIVDHIWNNCVFTYMNKHYKYIYFIEKYSTVSLYSNTVFPPWLSFISTFLSLFCPILPILSTPLFTTHHLFYNWISLIGAPNVRFVEMSLPKAGVPFRKVKP